MEPGFWHTLERPIIGLSPMDGVTDAPFRFITAKYGHPDIMMTEFTAAEGIRAGAERLLVDFMFDETERPVVAQLFGADPTAFVPAAAVACALGFDGIDINMGCPAKNIADRGAGASLIRDPERAKEIVRSTRLGIDRWANGASLEALGVPENIVAIVKARPEVVRRVLPVSIKTRVGYDEVAIEPWVEHLLEVSPIAISLHGRTLKQLYTGLADWEAIARGAAIIKQAGVLVLGNGDIASREDGLERVEKYGLDGALIGRASFGNPWVFTGHEPSLEERLSVALEHSRVHQAMLGDKAFLRMRKHLLDYTRGFDGAKELRQQLMRVSTLAEVESILIQ